jgi:hypothetical protein
MSCGGNRFQCNLTKSSRHQFKPDKPSNSDLHHENQKRLNDLLKEREEIDKQFFSINPNTSTNNTTVYTPQPNIQSDTYIPWISNNTNTENFTPWKVPSTSNYQSKAK